MLTATHYGDLAHFQETRLLQMAHVAFGSFETPFTRHRLAELQQRLVLTASRSTDKRRTRLARLTGQLSSLSPLATLARGYSLTLVQPAGILLHKHERLAAGTLLETRLPARRVLSRVESDEDGTDVQ